MIHEIKIESVDASESAVEWWGSVPFLKGKGSIPFSPGLNILYGPNGSGKSTILRTLARTLACEQGGVQAATLTYANSMRTRFGHPKKLKLGQVPVHDGSPVVYFGAEDVVGLSGGHFDDDFMLEGVRAAMAKGSSGQKLMDRLGLVAVAVRGEFKEISGLDRFDNGELKDLAALLAGTGPRVCPTILMDEPTRSLEMFFDVAILRMATVAASRGVQVILATHSPAIALANDLGGANIIETEPGYLDFCRALLTEIRDDWGGLMRDIQAHSPPHIKAKPEQAPKRKGKAPGKGSRSSDE